MIPLPCGLALKRKFIATEQDREADSVEGPVVIEPTQRDDVEMASRYLGAELGRWYADNNPSTARSAIARITPEHWRTMDFAKAMAG